MKHTSSYDLNQWEQTDRVLMEDFNADNIKIDAALHTQAEAIAAEAAAREAAMAACGNCAVVCGSYTGTGGYGLSSPQSLTFFHKPALVVIRDNNDTGLMGQLALVRGSTIANGYADGSGNMVRVTWSGNSVSWYNNSSNAAAQYNKSGTTYYYTALLMME